MVLACFDLDHNRAIHEHINAECLGNISLPVCDWQDELPANGVPSTFQFIREQ